ncbi:hypothetical protein [Cronobacter sakazakii]|uniref:hypothetical protein n=1 Tax=Cronobacter sakazakii TaxID=28141 RepID=UPI001EFC3F0F|nr:hypothetical protein [Cronobacter sakazakii]
MDKSREQFDQWLKQQGLKPVAWIKDEYWKVWKASRAAVEIELDEKVMVEDEFDKGHNCAIDYCAEAIRAAGLKVKGE